MRFRSFPSLGFVAENSKPFWSSFRGSHHIGFAAKDMFRAFCKFLILEGKPFYVALLGSWEEIAFLNGLSARSNGLNTVDMTVQDMQS